MNLTYKKHDDMIQTIGRLGERHGKSDFVY